MHLHAMHLSFTSPYSYHLSIASLCSLRLRCFDHLSLQDRTEGQQTERERKGRVQRSSSFFGFQILKKNVNMDTRKSIGREPTVTFFKTKKINKKTNPRLP